jgi:hypothetical protein
MFFGLRLSFHQKPAAPDSNPASVWLYVVKASLGRVGKLPLKQSATEQKLAAEKLESRVGLAQIIEDRQTPRTVLEIKAALQEQMAQARFRTRCRDGFFGCWHGGDSVS